MIQMNMNKVIAGLSPCYDYKRRKLMEIIFILLFAMLSIAIYIAADGLMSVAFDDDEEE